MGWKAYRSGTIPIGAVIVRESGEIVTKGRNRIFDKDVNNPLVGSNMAHAEMMAMLGLKEDEHPRIREYRLYTTMEPCPMCFGTAVMMSIRNIYYGARDGFAGASSLNDKLDYIKNKEINITKGVKEIEVFQLLIQSAYEYSRGHPRIEEILDTWREVDKLSIDLGKQLHKEGYFEQGVKENKDIGEIYDGVISVYFEI
ncbi:nucleoside deaminase [Halonatronum saccharophilum]|uniref:nucleoside deaminase n=1 Tax=Halonatronum saccharophilum TaxID=150060 RepID=UPI00048667E9|nr:nucleoside deaminase [Halonatronum saccharophilum]